MRPMISNDGPASEHVSAETHGSAPRPLHPPKMTLAMSALIVVSACFSTAC